MKARVREVVARQSEHPKEYVREYDKFLYLIDGTAEQEVREYVGQTHDFAHFCGKVRFFDELGTTLSESLPKEVNLGMFELHCDDLIQNLHRKTIFLRDQVLKKMSHDHQEENLRLCGEFDTISSTALSSPSNTEELVKLKDQVDMNFLHCE